VKISRNDRTWEYSVEYEDGRRAVLPSVTTVIDAALGTWRGQEIGLIEEAIHRGQDVGEVIDLGARITRTAQNIINAGDFGRKVHEATELDDSGILDEASLDPRIAACVSAWRAFKSEHAPKIMDSERMVASRLGYAGTVDALAMVKDKLSIIEKKSRAYNPARDQLQTAAYAQAMAENIGGKITLDRYVVSLSLDGKYSLHKNIDRGDLDIFRCCLAVFNWRRNKK